MTTSQATILVAHGSRNPAAQDAHEKLVADVATAAGTPARAAYLEIAEPSIGDAIDSAVSDGATSVVVVPCFLHPGNHVARDIPEIVAAARARHGDVELVLTAHLGSSPMLVSALASLATSASEA